MAIYSFLFLCYFLSFFLKSAKKFCEWKPANLNFAPENFLGIIVSKKSGRRILKIMLDKVIEWWYTEDSFGNLWNGVRFWEVRGFLEALWLWLWYNDFESEMAENDWDF